ncbi:efflux transporter outer membrane subunit [Nguyenibacter sp. L1]|uniref:efflux transporter outer membrane subunit n=1 Tax=Nguyenibacter sp. L1 TaxID=3049350 RepID=UPI002B4606D0|nr:efflux transporter outer membrane subunit [Nguyenibacter sp. L1]WRH89594.1 efflux transporter outer membrane subunit [Nguyenibacter sp. L1]
MNGATPCDGERRVMGDRRNAGRAARHAPLVLGGGIAAFWMALMLNGCAVGPDFVAPKPEIQNNWIESTDPRVVTTGDVMSHWWRTFNDPTLDRLIQIAATQNLPVRIAGLRILEARAQLGVAIGSMYPQTQEGFGAAQENLISSRLANQANLQHSFASFALGFDASWELDFWGRFRRNVEAAGANMGATVADYDDALVSLTAEVARTYAMIRTYEVFIQITRENARVQREGLDIATSRFRNGATSELDASQARTLLESTLADIAPLQSSEQQAKNALSTLLGRPPGSVDALLYGPQYIPTASSKVAVGIPAELLRRRPDIRAAELRAATESARIGVAKADLYPRFTLFGEIGVQSSSMSTFLAPGSRFFTTGPGFRWPILNYGRLTNNVRAQDARFQQAAVTYQDTVLKAQREVEDALIGFLKAQDSAINAQRSVQAGQRSVQLSLTRYREGAEDYQRVVDSQRILLQSENRLADTQSSIATYLIALYKALGGGWEVGAGKPIIPEAMQAEMARRTNWGKLLPAHPPPATDELAPPTPAGNAPILRKPIW